jgi:hypothetical protein
MLALRVQMHLYRNPGVHQGGVVNERVVDAVHVIIFSLQQKGRRSPCDRGDRP